MQTMSHGASWVVQTLLLLANLLKSTSHSLETAQSVFTLKVGLYANTFFKNGSYDDNGAQSIAGFMMAVEEINKNPIILPNVKIAVAFRSGRGSYGAITAAQSFISANFSTNSLGLNEPKTAFIGNNPIGVDVVLGAADDIETEQTNQILNFFKIVQLHTVAMNTDLGIGQNYPYKLQTTPIISFEGLVMQNLLCDYFNLQKIAVFATEDNNGLKSITEIADGTYCELNLLSVQTFGTERTDYSELIPPVKSSGALILVLFMPPIPAAMLLEQAYDQGLLVEGTQVFGNSLATDSSIWTYFKNKENAKIIMKGFIGVKYAPKFGIHTTKAGREFAQRYSQQANTVVTHADGITTCVNLTDDTGEYLYRSPKHSTVGPVQCSGLNFSRFHTNGTNMFPFTPHAYDAVYALAQGIENILLEGSKNTITGDTIHSTFIRNVSMEGVTGIVQFKNALSEFLYYSLGVREVGNTYIMYNFNDVMYDATNGTDAFAIVGKWHFESGGVTPCTEDNEMLFGGECEEFIYRTSDNSPPSDMLPEIYVDLPASISLFLFVMGSIVLVIVSISGAVILMYRNSRLIKASQPSMIYMIHLGCFLGGVRAILGGLPFTDYSCRSVFFFSHLTFFVTYIPLVAKIWRLQRVFNNKSLKRLNLPWRFVIQCTMGSIFSFMLYVVMALIVGEPYRSSIFSVDSNRGTNVLTCDNKIPQLQISIYCMEVAVLVYSLHLINKIRDIPDPIDEIRFYTTAMVLMTIVLVLVLSTTRLLTLPSGVAELITGIGFCVVSSVVVCILFIPKFEKLYFNEDLRYSDYEAVNPLTMKLEKILKKWKMRRIVAVEPQQMVTFKDLCSKSYAVSMTQCRSEMQKWRLLHMEINEMEDRSVASGSSQSSRRPHILVSAGNNILCKSIDSAASI